ncbi:hypothetical protein EV426DRAFT_706096 [Tirmania nivea]|nr:hypothetical protein EV426DRAFT_706096 [Tirmania nivea]
MGMVMSTAEAWAWHGNVYSGGIHFGGMAMSTQEVWQCRHRRYVSADSIGMAVSTLEACSGRYWRHGTVDIGSQTVLMSKARQPSYLCEPNLPGWLDNPVRMVSYACTYRRPGNALTQIAVLQFH